MALGTVNSDVAAKEADPYFGNRIDPIRIRGSVVIAECLYELGTGLAATDIIRLIKLPERARVIPHLCWLECENPGTALVLDVGDDDDTDAADPDRYADALTVSAGGGFPFTGADGVATLTPYTLQKESWIQATVATATSLTAGQDLRFYIGFVVNA